jgi:hypothetical protein
VNVWIVEIRALIVGRGLREGREERDEKEGRGVFEGKYHEAGACVSAKKLAQVFPHSNHF